jgi:hypothetical protein
MKANLLCALCCLCLVASAQKDVKRDTVQSVVFPEIGWELRMGPTTLMDSAQYKVITEAANKVFNDLDHTDVDYSKLIHPLFMVTEGRFNQFAAAIRLFDSSHIKWPQYYAKSKQAILDILKKQQGAIKILDSSSKNEVIGGLEFQTFYLETFYPAQNLTLHSYWICRKLHQYEFNINISYKDEAIGEKWLNIVHQSKFIKPGTGKKLK